MLKINYIRLEQKYESKDLLLTWVLHRDTAHPIALHARGGLFMAMLMGKSC
jgi:hypothetical protein